MGREGAPPLPPTLPGVATPVTPADRRDVELAPGTHLGAYRIVRLLGAGGMGAVYEAHDSRLDRTVALKVLRPDSGAGSPDELRSRLMREALILAKLSHPALLTIYEVGEVDGEPFIATELVAGGTLREWLRARARTARETLDLFVQAGRGLAAAHGAGLVHRDFKPDNVLIDRGGRARVADFGLAAPAGDDRDPTAGTPGYMAPEQHAGAPAGARCDQYAFCVALHEALSGTLPFKAETVGELGRVKRTQPPRPLEGVHGALRAAVARGLEVDPARRHPSMEALLAILEHDPSARRRRLLLLGATAAIAAGAAVLATRVAAPEEACSGGERILAGVWDGGVKARLAQAFAATGRPYAAATTGRVTDRLDGYFGELVATRRRTCEATVRRKEQSAELLDLRMRCLDGLVARAGALVSLFVDRPAAEVVDRAVSATAGLGDAAACAAALSGAAPPPADPALRRRIAAVDAVLARSQALVLAGQPRPGAALAETAAAEARALGDRALAGRALGDLGAARLSLVQSAAAEAAYREALAVAAAEQDDGLAARAWLGIYSALVAGDRNDQADGLGFFLDAAVSRAGDPPRLRGQALDQRARNALEQGRYEEAQGLAEQAVAALERSGPSGDVKVRGALVNLANIERQRGRAEAALALDERLLKMSEAIDGPEHPNVAAILSNAGGRLCYLGDTERALPLVQRSLAIREKAFGPDSDEVAISLNNLGFCYDVAERFDEAELWFARTLALEEKLEGKDSKGSFRTLVAAGASAREAGHYDLARDRLGRAVAIAAREYGPDHPSTASATQELGMLDSFQGHFAEALEPLRRAVAIRDKTSPGEMSAAVARTELGWALCLGGKREEGLAMIDGAAAIERRLRPDSLETTAALTDLADCQLAAGGPPVAIGELERLLALHAGKPRKWLLSRLRFAIARARWAANDDRGRARALAVAARDALRSLAPGGARELAAVEAWLATHAQ